MSEYKCPHCEYYMWEGKEFYECEFQDKVSELEQENERLKALCDTYRTCYQARHGDIKCLLPKYRTTLQEIKAIAEKPKPFKDFSEIKTATEVEYDYATICNELELRLHKVLELITKAEEE